jgi:hypothetical protein
MSVGSVRAPKSTSGLSNILVELILMVPRLRGLTWYTDVVAPVFQLMLPIAELYEIYN